MNSAERMRRQLEPLNIYRWEGSYQWAELQSQGGAIDACQAELEEIFREINLRSASSFGLERIHALLARGPRAQSIEAMREALAALLRIQDGSFTLSAINDNLSGCGLMAEAEELEFGKRLRIVFPSFLGIPPEFETVRAIIEDILPCHLEVEYRFRFLTWRMLEERGFTWRSIEAGGLSWYQLQTAL